MKKREMSAVGKGSASAYFLQVEAEIRGMQMQVSDAKRFSSPLASLPKSGVGPPL